MTNFYLTSAQLKYVAKLAVLYDVPTDRRPQEFEELDALWKSLTKDEQDNVDRYLSQNDPPPHRRGVI